MIPKPKSIFIKFIINKTHLLNYLHLKSDNLVPSDTFLQQFPVGVNHVDDDGHNVTDEDEDDEDYE